LESLRLVHLDRRFFKMRPRIIQFRIDRQRHADWTGFFLQGELIEWGEGKNLFVAPKEKRTEDYVTGWFG
jgi:ABC-type phosphate transport system ATPase subunit